VEEHLAAGEPTLLEIELHGARQVRAAMPQACCVPAAAILGRAGPSAGRPGQRAAGFRGRPVGRARIEMAAEDEFDAVIVNDDVERAAAELVGLLESACRPDGD
jgi:guanylate kinase